MFVLFVINNLFKELTILDVWSNMSSTISKAYRSPSNETDLLFKFFFVRQIKKVKVKKTGI